MSSPHMLSLPVPWLVALPMASCLCSASVTSYNFCQQPSAQPCPRHGCAGLYSTTWLQTSVSPPGWEPTQPLALRSVRLADAVVKDFITSPPPLMPGLSHDVDLLDSCPDPMELSGEPQDFGATPAASSRNVNIFGGRPCRSCPPVPHWCSSQTQSAMPPPVWHGREELPGGHRGA